MIELSTSETTANKRKTTKQKAIDVQGPLRSFRYDPKPVVLTPAQKVVVQLICCGMADKEIAYLLGLSNATVKAHLSRVIKLMGLYRRHQVVRFIFENDLFAPESIEFEVRNWRVAKRRRRNVSDRHDNSAVQELVEKKELCGSEDRCSKRYQSNVTMSAE